DPRAPDRLVRRRLRRRLDHRQARPQRRRPVSAGDVAHDAPNQTPGEAPRDGEAPADGRGPGLDDSLRAINAARREAMGASRGTARALRQLVSADVALARGALVRGLGWAVGALVFGASAWLLFAATLVALMQRAGLSWLQSLALAALLSL